MIETLRIVDLAIVEEVELEFGPGLNVLTGETGAGKSIVLGALGLLAGGRASADAVREGSERAVVDAVFRTEALPELRSELREAGLEPEGAEAAAGELLVQRSVHANGRGRVRISGQLVPVSTLAGLFEGRIEISSQHSSQALLRPGAHALLLDEAGGLLGQRRAVEEGCAVLRRIDAELAGLRQAAEERARREDFLRFQLEEIDAVELREGELGRVEGEQRRLAHAEQLREEGGGAAAALAGDPMGEAPGAVDLLARAQRSVASLAKMDADLAPLGERLRGLEDDLRDAAADLERYVDRLEVDPGRLAVLEERLAQIERLRRKYGDDVPAILATRDSLAEELDRIEGADARIGELEGARVEHADALTRAARKLSRARARAAKDLVARVEEPLRDLSLPEARFEVALTPVEPPASLPCGPGGLEAAEFLFAANAGHAPKPLQRVASGGELSRVFLAVKNALRGAGRGMVLVFDEVDAGIGGGVAERVGRKLAELAERNQVLCITHHPQIAALADVHFRVVKAKRGGQTLARVERLEGEARVDEIARMAGGETISKETRRHAAVLLGQKSPD